MAGKPKNRLELRRQYEAAEPLDPMEDESDDAGDGDDEDGGERKPKKKARPPAKSKSKSAKAPKPAARMRIVWVVVNDAFKQIATFEYAQKDAADAKAAEMTAKGKGTHFVQRVKEPMPDASGAVPEKPAAPARPSRAKAAPKPAVIEDDEPADDEEEEEEEAEEEEDEDEE